MIHVFYGGQYLGEFANPRAAWKEYDCPHSDIYQGGVIYWPVRTRKLPTEDIGFAKQWYNMDLTPILPEDVPAKLKLLVLILNI